MFLSIRRTHKNVFKLLLLTTAVIVIYKMQNSSSKEFLTPSVKNTIVGSRIPETLDFQGNIKVSSKNTATDTTIDWKKLEPILHKVAIKKTLMLSLTDRGVVDMTINFYISSILPHNITNYIFLTLDSKFCLELQQQNIACFAASTNFDATNKACNFRSPDCIKKMLFRLQSVKEIVARGYNVLLSDVDMIFFQNPLNYLLPRYNYSWDVLYSENTRKSLNGGFILFINTANTVQMLEQALEHMSNDTKLDDQDALNRVVKTSPSFQVLQMDHDKFVSGRTYWETLPFQREFSVASVPCHECIVIHNNWIVSLEAKRYRMRESGFWNYDGPDQYYSAPDRLYMTYFNPRMHLLHTMAMSTEWNALQNALAIAELLNRTLILPMFKCVVTVSNRVRSRECSLLHRVRLSTFENEFPNYREHVFLSHPLVPTHIKKSLTPLYCFDQPSKSTEKFVSLCERKLSIIFPHKGVTMNEVLDFFSRLKEKVLRFSWLYNALDFASFAERFPDIEKRIKRGFQACSYRQHEDCH